MTIGTTLQKYGSVTRQLGTSADAHMFAPLKKRCETAEGADVCAGSFPAVTAYSSARTDER